MSNTSPNGAVTEPDQLRAEIDRTRDDLARTVDELTARLDFKARAKQKTAEATQAVKSSVVRAKQAAPTPVARSMDQAEGGLQRAAAWAKPHLTVLLLGAAGATAVLVGLRRHGSRRFSPSR